MTAQDAPTAAECSNDNLSHGLIAERMSTPPPSLVTISTVNPDESDLYIFKVAVADLQRQFQTLLLDQQRIKLKVTALQGDSERSKLSLAEKLEDGEEMKRKVDILTKAVMNLSLASQQGHVKDPIVTSDSADVLRGRHSEGDSGYTVPIPTAGNDDIAGDGHETNDADVSLISDTDMCDTEHHVGTVKGAANICSAEDVGDQSEYEDNTPHLKKNDHQRTTVSENRGKMV